MGEISNTPCWLNYETAQCDFCQHFAMFFEAHQSWTAEKMNEF